MTGVRKSSHLSYSHNHEEIIRVFFSLHKEKIDPHAWQLAPQIDDFKPIFSNDDCSQIRIDRSGKAYGLSEPITKLIKDSFTNCRAKSVFGSNSAYGILFEDGRCICHLCHPEFANHVTKCNDLHASGWGISAIGEDRSNLLHINAITHVRLIKKIEEELEFCFCLGSSNLGSISFGLSKKNLYRFSKNHNGQIDSTIEFEFGENSVIELVCRANNFSVFKLGEKTLVLDREEAFTLDTKVERCYISQRCYAFLTTHGWIFRSMMNDSILDICQDMKEELDWHVKNSSEGCLTMQAMLDPMLAIGAGTKGAVRDCSSWICSHRASLLRNPSVAKALEGTSSYSLIRMFKNDYGK